VKVTQEKLYDRDFYKRLHVGGISSAIAVLSELRELLSPGPPDSIVDIGCGDGSWLRVARDLFGARRILGMDGPGVKEAGCLLLGIDEFRVTDLRKELPVLLTTYTTFDLAMCLEVAEHLPESCAKPLVEVLCGFAPLVLFSAAVPTQGGTAHINEQWPSYWIRIFAEAGWQCLDALRYRIWSRADVEWWYRQNVLLFASDDALNRWPNLLRLLREEAVPTDFDLVHPEFLKVAVARRTPRPSRVRLLLSRVLRSSVRSGR